MRSFSETTRPKRASSGAYSGSSCTAGAASNACTVLATSSTRSSTAPTSNRSMIAATPQSPNPVETSKT